MLVFWGSCADSRASAAATEFGHLRASKSERARDLGTPDGELDEALTSVSHEMHLKMFETKAVTIEYMAIGFANGQSSAVP